MPDVQWRNTEKRYDKEHHEMVSFIHLAEFENDTFLFCFRENVFFTSYVSYVISSCRKTFKL